MPYQEDPSQLAASFFWPPFLQVLRLFSTSLRAAGCTLLRAEVTGCESPRNRALLYQVDGFCLPSRYRTLGVLCRNLCTIGRDVFLLVEVHLFCCHP